MKRNTWSDIWPAGSPLIGMVHLLPLPGSPAWNGRMGQVIDRARRDATALASAGFDGLIVENYADVPFMRGRVPPVTVAAMTRCLLAVASEVELPLGVNVLRNDPAAALGIAAATDARFVRVNVHCGAMWTDQGLIEGDAAGTLRLRSALGVETAILADVHVKHATPPHGESISAAAKDGWHRGRADALIVSGTGTGAPTDPGDLATVRLAVPDAPVLVGSGATPANAQSLLEDAAGLIVGSAVMHDGVAGTGVDPARAADFVTAARG